MADPEGSAAHTAFPLRDLPCELEGLGGFLRCEVCKRREPLSRSLISDYLRWGWPRCHHLTMRWWTARQVANGEAPNE